MTQPNGLNIALRYVNMNTLYQRLDVLNAAVHTVMIDKDEHIAYALDLADRYPNSLFVLRVKNDHDGGYHTPPQNDPQKRPRIAEPVDFLNRWGMLGSKRNTSLYTLNEPLINEKSTALDFKRLTDWYVETVTLAAARNISLTGPNFGMGQPALNTEQTEWDARLDPILRVITDNRYKMYLGLHEYGPEKPYHLGRLLFMLARCRILKIPPPRVILTEFGVDSPTSAENGYHARGWSGDYYFRQMKPVIKEIYMPLVESGILIGWTFFMYGLWPAFDLEHDEMFFKELTASVNDGSLKPSSPPPVVEAPKPAPEPEKPADPTAPVELPPPPAPDPTPARKERRLEIVVTATDEEWAQLSVLAEGAVAALSKFAGLSELVKTFLPRLVIRDLSI